MNKSQTPCSCGKIGVYCKGLCQACYSRMQRNTPTGKARLKLYNDTKGKEAQKRYLLKKKLNYRPREKKEKTLCECGKMSVIKGCCRGCYNRKKYQREHPKRERIKINTDKFFELVLAEVAGGLTIEKACKKLSIDRGLFYSCITKEQKAELKISKAKRSALFDIANEKYLETENFSNETKLFVLDLVESGSEIGREWAGYSDSFTDYDVLCFNSINKEYLSSTKEDKERWESIININRITRKQKTSESESKREEEERMEQLREQAKKRREDEQILESLARENEKKQSPMSLFQNLIFHLLASFAVKNNIEKHSNQFRIYIKNNYLRYNYLINWKVVTSVSHESIYQEVCSMLKGHDKLVSARFISYARMAAEEYSCGLEDVNIIVGLNKEIAFYLYLRRDGKMEFIKVIEKMV